MLPVSAGYRSAITADERQLLGRVTIDYTDPFMDQSLTASMSEQGNAAGLAGQVHDSLTDPLRRWASLDGSTLADGSSFAAPVTTADGQMGWWGSQLSGAGGAFVPPFPTLTITHTARPVHSLRVVGDIRRSEFPVDFEIRLLGTGGVVRHTRTVTGNALIDWGVSITPVTEVIQQMLIIHRWSHTGRQVKILEFYTSVQETYEGDGLVGIDLLEERELSQGSLPIGNISANEIRVKLDNSTRRFDAGNRQSPLAGLLRHNRRIRAWLGVVLAGGGQEFVPLGTFWSTDWHARQESVYAETTGLDRLELLRKSTYSHSFVMANTNLHALATAVLQDAGLTASEFWVDPALMTYTVPNAFFEPVSHREALRVIAEAGLGQVYCDRNGVVRIEGSGYLYENETFIMPGFAAMQSVSITPDNAFRIDTPTRWGEIANVIEVETMPLRPVATAIEVFRSNEPVSIAAGQTLSLTAFYNERPVIEGVASLVDAPAGATITAATHYAWGANITVSSPNAGTFILVINGRPLRVLNRERVTAEDAVSIREHGRLRFRLADNRLIQSTAVAQRIADILLRMYRNSRRDVEAEWRGNPALTPSDMIAVQEQGTHLHYWVTRQTLEFDGALNSTVTGRRAL